MQNDLFLQELSKIGSGATFLTVSEYTNSVGEVADYSITFHVSYQSLLLRSLVQLESYVPENELELKAKQELAKSYQASLDKMNSTEMEQLEEHYTHFKDSNGNYIKGVKLHNASNALHIYGVVVHKRVITPGTYKKVESKPLTLAKNKISNMLPISKWRQFKITPEQVKSINVQHKRIEV